MSNVDTRPPGRNSILVPRAGLTPALPISYLSSYAAYKKTAPRSQALAWPGNPLPAIFGAALRRRPVSIPPLRQAFIACACVRLYGRLRSCRRPFPLSAGDLADSNRPDFGTCLIKPPHLHAGLAAYKTVACARQKHAAVDYIVPHHGRTYLYPVGYQLFSRRGWDTYL